MTDKKKELVTDSEPEDEEIDIEEKDDDDDNVVSASNKAEDKVDLPEDINDRTGKNKTVEQNGFSTFQHRLNDNFLKRKFPDFHGSDNDGDDDEAGKQFSRKHVLTEDHFAHRIRKEQLFPMDASLKTLSESGLGMGSITNKHTISSATKTSICDDRLKATGSSDLATAGSSGLDTSTRISENKEGPKLPFHKPSFLITDILSTDNSRKDRDNTCHSVFSDPRLFAVTHRNFLDRTLPSAACGGQDRNNPSVQRFTDDSDFDDDDDDDKSESDGKYVFKSIFFVKQLLKWYLLEYFNSSRFKFCRVR